MEAAKKVRIGDNEYTVKMFDPMTAFEFFHDMVEAQETKRSLSPLAKRAFAQCLDPNLRALGDQANFQAWFSQYPEDMIELERKAMEVLVAPFVRNRKDISATENG